MRINMPPHCDTMDGPVVKAAKAALEAGDVNLVLPWVPKAAEHELKEAFESVVMIRKHCESFTPGLEVAERWLFETVVRLHRAGEGAAYAGLKPAGMDTGPVIPRAEAAIESGDVTGVVKFLSRVVEEEVSKRFENAMAKRHHDKNDVAEARAYVEAMLDFLLHAHGAYKALVAVRHHAEDGAAGTKKGGHER